MAINTLHLQTADTVEELSVLRFDYSGQVNNFYEIKFRCVGNLSTESISNVRFEFNYGSKQFANGSIYGFIKKIVKTYDNQLARNLYIVTGVSAVGMLEKSFIKKAYSDTNAKAIIADVLSFIPNTSPSYQDDCKLLASQSNYNQLLQGSVLEFFNYQFNNLGFYIVKDSADGDVVNIYSNPKYITELAGSYDLAIKDYGRVTIEHFGGTKVKHRQSVNIKGYDIAQRDNRHYPVNKASSTVRQETCFYDNHYKSDDREELAKRKSLSSHSLDKLSELIITNVVYREGDLLRLSGNKYWVYDSQVIATLNEDEHWESRSLLQLLPVEGGEWYPPEVARPIARAIEGFSYNPSSGLDNYSSLPLSCEAPFANNAEDKAGSARQVILSSSKEGGHFSSFKDKTRLLITTTDNNDQDRVAIGHTSDIKADELVKDKNFHDNGIVSSGNVGLSVTRNRQANDYSKLSLYSEREGKRSELSLGGVATTNDSCDFMRESYKSSTPNLEGIIERSVSNALELGAGTYSHTVAGLEDIATGTTNENLNYHKEKHNADSYLYRYYAKSFAENEGDSPKLKKNYINKLVITTDKREDDLDTSVVWQSAITSPTEVTLDNKTTKADDNYSFNHKDTNYNIKLKLDDDNELNADCDITAELKRLSIALEPSQNAHQYQCSIGWSLATDKEIKVSIARQEVDSELGKAFIDLKDSSSLDIKIDDSSIKLTPCQLNRVESDNVDLPRGDLIIQSSSGNIAQESNLEEYRGYTGVLLESEANQEVDILTKHDSYQAKKYSLHSQRELTSSHDAKTTLKANNYYTDALAKAEDADVDGIYTREHKGGYKYTQNDKLEKDYKVTNLIVSKFADEDINIEHQKTSEVKQQAKTKAVVSVQGDVIYKSNTATRKYKKLIIGGQPDMSIASAEGVSAVAQAVSGAVATTLTKSKDKFQG